MKPLFSVIVPVYKTEKYLHRCVDSVLEQTFENWEMILVDDGSPDGSGAICDAYGAKDGRIRVIHKENGGPTAARTVGARLACGAFVLLLDSDDEYAPGLFEALADILETHKPDAIIFGGETFDTDSPEAFGSALPEGMYAHGQLGQSLILDSRHQMVVSYGLSAKALPTDRYRSLQEQVPEELYRGEDMAVSVPLLDGCERVFVSHFCGYRYRCTPGSIMNTFREDEPKQLQLLTAHLQKTLDEGYHSRIAAFAVQQAFDWLDRAMVGRAFGEYKTLAKRGLAELDGLLRSGRSRSPRLREKMVFWLTAHRCCGTLWLLRKLKPRK